MKIFNEIKVAADNKADRIVQECVISIPYDCSNAKKKAIENAAKLAGFEYVNFVVDPITIAFAYDLHLS